MNVWRVPLARILYRRELSRVPCLLTWDSIQRPFGDQSGSVASCVGGVWVSRRWRVPSELVKKISPRVCSALKYRRNAIRPFSPLAVASARAADTTVTPVRISVRRLMRRLTRSPRRQMSRWWRPVSGHPTSHAHHRPAVSPSRVTPWTHDVNRPHTNCSALDPSARHSKVQFGRGSGFLVDRLSGPPRERDSVEGPPIQEPM